MDTQYNNLSAEQKRRLENIVSIIRWTVDEPENFIKNVSTDTVLRLMERLSRDEAVVDELVEMQEHDEILDSEIDEAISELYFDSLIAKAARAIDKAMEKLR